jgi:peptidoglycan/LPS O-acetylase OafA/YrhL
MTRQLKFSDLKQKLWGSNLDPLPEFPNTGRSFDLDFLRGLFVLGILIYHIVPNAPVGLGQGSMEGFFCLSGFLITKTLLRRIPQGWTGLEDFAINRLRRLMPALLLYLGLVGFLNVWFARADLGLVLKSIGLSILGFYNWFEVLQERPLPGLGGIWSLSVEDQFYMLLITSAALLIGLRLERKKVLFFLILYALFLVTSLGIRVGNAAWWTDQKLSAVSYLTPQRLWAFGWGGLAALIFLIDSKKRGLLNWLRKIHPAIWLGLAFWTMITVKNYNAYAFLHGWLWCSLPIAVCIFCITLRQGSPPIFSAGGRFSIWIAQAGVACYPIYLFQEFEKNLNLSLPWVPSFTLSILLGSLVHQYFEKKFYSFSKYTT